MISLSNRQKMPLHRYESAVFALWTTMLLHVVRVCYAEDCCQPLALVHVNESSPESVSKIIAMTVPPTGACSEESMRITAHCACYFLYTQQQNPNSNDSHYPGELYSFCVDSFGADMFSAQSSCSSAEVGTKENMDMLAEVVVQSCSSLYEIKPTITSTPTISSSISTTLVQTSTWTPSKTSTATSTPIISSDVSTTPVQTTTWTQSKTPTVSLSHSQTVSPPLSQSPSISSSPLQSVLPTPFTASRNIIYECHFKYYWWYCTYLWVPWTGWIVRWKYWRIIRYYWWAYVWRCYVWWWWWC